MPKPSLKPSLKPELKQAPIQSWRREAVLYLVQYRPDRTAAELADLFGALCTAEGLSEKLWRNVDPTTMHGILRALEKAGQVIRAGDKRDSRAGRDSPKWCVSAGAKVPPNFPDYELAAAGDTAVGGRADVPRENDVEHPDLDAMTKPQLYALFEVLDEQAGINARLMQDLERERQALNERSLRYLREMRDFSERARRKLAGVGFEVPTP